MNERLAPLAPEVTIGAGAVIGLLVGSWLPRHRQWVVRAIVLAACLTALAFTAWAATQRATMDFEKSYAIDVATNTVRLAVVAATAMVIGMAVDWVHGHRRETELYVLAMLAALGAIAMAGANDLLTLFAAYLLASVPLYALAGFDKDDLGTEATLKYYLMGALSGVVMLGGITMIYAAGHTTAYGPLPEALAEAPHGLVTAGVLAVFAGLLFKAGGVPVHYWVPDVTEGAPTPVAALVTTVPKIGGLVAMFRFLSEAVPTSTVDWPLLVAVLSAASMTLGNFAAFFQVSVKRLLAYSTISQVGYVLMVVAVATRSDLALKSLLFYLAAYAATNLGAFAVAAALPHARTIDDYRGMAHEHRWLAAVLIVCLLGLVGTPPTAVFLGKLNVFAATIDGGYTWLAALAIANTVASLFYYLRWLVPAFLRPAPNADASALRPARRWSARSAYLTGTISVGLGVAGGVILAAVNGRLLH